MFLKGENIMTKNELKILAMENRISKLSTSKNDNKKIITKLQRNIRNLKK